MEVFETNYELNEKVKHITKVLEIDGAHIMNIQLRKNERIQKHHAKEDALIVVRRGRVEFDVEGEKVTLTNESILHMVPLEEHDLVALEDSDILVIKVD